MVRRRDFMKGALAAGTLAVAQQGTAAERSSRISSLVDVNVNLSRWPLRRLRGDDAEGLAQMLRKAGVRQAWAGSFDALLHKDLSAVNARLADQCRNGSGTFFLPFGSVNPKAPAWEEELRRCVELHRMRGIRLHPNYHGYKLDDPEFRRLLALAAELKLVVQLALLMEDERMMHPLLRVEPVETGPLPAVLNETPGARLVLLNALGKVRGKALNDLVKTGEVYVEIGMLEGVAGIGTLLESVPLERVLFGSHAPLFYLESALLKLKETPLTAGQLRAIGRENAERVLAKNR